MKKRKIALFAVSLLALVVAASAMSAGPRPKRGDVGTPEQSLNAMWVAGTSQDAGVKGTSLEMGPGFAYFAFRGWWDHNLSDVTKVQASWLLDSGNLGGSPRFSLMLDANGDGVNDIEDGTVDPGDVDVNVFLDPAWCSDPAPNDSDWVVSDFTGDRTNCTIFDSTGASYSSDADGTAWSKLVAAYPDAKVWFMFLIQDASPGTNYVDRIKLDSAFFS